MLMSSDDSIGRREPLPVDPASPELRLSTVMVAPAVSDDGTNLIKLLAIPCLESRPYLTRSINYFNVHTMLLHLDGRMHNKKLLCNVEMLTIYILFL